MPKLCRKCGVRHPPPTGKKCQWQDGSHLLQNSINEDGGDGGASPQAKDMETLASSIKALQEDMSVIKSQLQSSSSSRRGSSTPNSAPKQPTSTDDLDAKVRQRMKTLLLLSDSDESDGGSDSEKSRRSHRKGKKSGRARTADDYVLHEIDWPHLHVYRGASRTPAKFEELSVQEFAFGYMACVHGKGVDSTQRALMLRHFQALMQDAMEFSWEATRNCHGIILAQMEMGRLSWEDSDQLHELRRIYAQKAPSTTSAPHKRSGGKDGPLFCVPFQEGKCTQQEDHDTARGLVKHICAFCLKATGSVYPHPEFKCRRKMWQKGHIQAKNEEH